MKENNQRGQRLVKRIYKPRIVGMGLGFLCVASVFYQTDAHIIAWLLAIVHGLIWPHVAYRVAINSRRPYFAERRNLLIDSFFVGFWVPLMSFSLLPSFVLIVFLSMSTISVGGVSLFIRGIMLNLFGSILAIILFGFKFQPEPTMLNIIVCLPFLTIYPVMIGMIAYQLSLQLSKRRIEIQDMLDQVKTLSGLLPICSSCKKIRNDKGYWSQIETYISEHSEADFSHSICPDCARELYPDIKLKL